MRKRCGARNQKYLYLSCYFYMMCDLYDTVISIHIKYIDVVRRDLIGN